MSGFEDLEDLFSRRLLAAAHRDFMDQTSPAGYEEELQRQRELRRVILTPEIKLQRAVFPTDVGQLLVIKEEPPEQQEWSSTLDQEDSKTLQIKEEQIEFWCSQTGEQLQKMYEADTVKFPGSPVPVKTEDKEEKPQSLTLYQRRTGPIEPGVDREYYKGQEPTRYSDLEGHLQSGTVVKTEVSSQPETGDRDDKCRETRDHHPGLITLENTEQTRPKRKKKQRNCSVCGKTFKQNIHLTNHMMIHTGERPFSCSECSLRFTQKGSLTRHMTVHIEKKPFGCSVCGEKFTQRGSLTQHLAIHRGEKLFNCSVW
ncbi:zinc finger protein 2 homolog [Xyrichtys novacula]|uniref:Zinc finger protein 2 homolog n=1 Tax=Xyrichtys novacula TaxID=13765 RepID=A0AAV1HA67_XYRNO|nr:zinc finger protein 2 homolog [Xyrichtys novacula]